MDNEKLISRILSEIQKDPSNYRAYEDLFSICRSVEGEDFKLAHNANYEMRSYINRGMKAAAYRKILFYSTHSTQRNKAPRRVYHSTRCFVVCPNSNPMKNNVFGLSSNGGDEGARTHDLSDVNRTL